MVRVRVRSVVMDYISESPHKNGNVCVSVCLIPTTVQALFICAEPKYGFCFQAQLEINQANPQFIL